MRFSVPVVAALAAGVSAQNASVAYTTAVVTSFTTFCPAATQITQNGVTYTVKSVSNRARAVNGCQS